MKIENITLPTLRVAVAVFALATTCYAEIYCVDRSLKVVEKINCEGSHNSANFFLVSGPPNMALDTAILPGLCDNAKMADVPEDQLPEDLRKRHGSDQKRQRCGGH
ncbi:hypothetical protein F4819DRAFT_508323 [Hypoxylon fuscum]|nr:hypothetical protein F4819DRAFT_508323 [Hypoxylon fuscum]